MWEFFFEEHDDAFVPHQGAVVTAVFVGALSLIPLALSLESLRAGQLGWALGLLAFSGTILLPALSIPRRLIVCKEGLLYLSLFDWYEWRRTSRRRPRTFVPWSRVRSLRIYRDHSRGAELHARRAVLSARRRGNFEMDTRCKAWVLLMRRVAKRRPEIVRDASSSWWSFLQ